jgi:hypothetical protein
MWNVVQVLVVGVGFFFGTFVGFAIVVFGFIIEYIVA